MASERLSKLQKWILVQALEVEEYLPKEYIYREFYQLKKSWDRNSNYYYKNSEDSKKAKSAYVSVSRTIRQLREKGLIKSYCYYHNGEGYHERNYFNYDYIKLTEEGKIKALMLMSSSKGTY